MSEITVELRITQGGNTVTERATLANPVTAVSFLARAVEDLGTVLTEDELQAELTTDSILSAERSFETDGKVIDFIKLV